MGLQPRAAAAENQSGFGSAVAPPTADQPELSCNPRGGSTALHMEGGSRCPPSLANLSHYSRAEPWISLPLGSDGAAVRGDELPDATISALAVAGGRLSPLVAGEVIDGTPGEEHL
jgi:hypothetical protein